MVKTLRDLFSLGSLTERDRQANSLAPLLNLATPRTECPTTLNPVADSEAARGI